MYFLCFGYFSYMNSLKPSRGHTRNKYYLCATDEDIEVKAAVKLGLSADIQDVGAMLLGISYAVPLL